MPYNSRSLLAPSAIRPEDFVPDTYFAEDHLTARQKSIHATKTAEKRLIEGERVGERVCAHSWKVVYDDFAGEACIWCSARRLIPHRRADQLCQTTKNCTVESITEVTASKES